MTFPVADDMGFLARMVGDLPATPPFLHGNNEWCNVLVEICTPGGLATGLSGETGNHTPGRLHGKTWRTFTACAAAAGLSREQCLRNFRGCTMTLGRFTRPRRFPSWTRSDEVMWCSVFVASDARLYVHGVVAATGRNKASAPADSSVGVTHSEISDRTMARIMRDVKRMYPWGAFSPRVYEDGTHAKREAWPPPVAWLFEGLLGVPASPEATATGFLDAPPPTAYCVISVKCENNDLPRGGCVPAMRVYLQAAGMMLATVADVDYRPCLWCAFVWFAILVVSLWVYWTQSAYAPAVKITPAVHILKWCVFGLTLLCAYANSVVSAERDRRAVLRRIAYGVKDVDDSTSVTCT